MRIMPSGEIQDTTLSKVLKSIHNRYILDVLMYDEKGIENKQVAASADVFYHNYQPVFMGILAKLSISISSKKKTKAYILKDTPDDVFNILKYGCKNSVVKDFLCEENPTWNIFNNVSDILYEMKNFRAFAISVTNFCNNNGVKITNKNKQEIIDRFSDIRKYNSTITLLQTMRGTHQIQKIIEVLLSSATIDDESAREIYHRLNQFQEQQDFIIEQIERIKRDNLL